MGGETAGELGKLSCTFTLCVLKEMEWKRGDREPDYVTSALFSGVESVLPGFGRPFPAGEFPADPPPFDPRGEAPTG